MGWSKDTIRKVAKRTGSPVVEAWSGHNKGAMGVIYGPMLHHTGTPASYPGDYPTLKVVRDGRPGLENSLCMFGLGKSGTIYLINDKISWHAGAGNWNGVTDGNGHFAGIEAEGPGTWSAAQLDSYQKLCASILLETGKDINWMPTHAQFALPRGRKTDPTGIDMNAFKKKVQQYLANPSLLGVEGGSDMPLTAAEWDGIVGRMDRQILPALYEIRFNVNEAKPFKLYRYSAPTAGDWVEGTVFLAGDGLWWRVPNPDVLATIQYVRLAGDLIYIGNADQMELIRNLWSLAGGKTEIDLDALSAKINPQIKAITTEDIDAIAKRVNDVDDARDRDGDPKTGETS